MSKGVLHLGAHLGHEAGEYAQMKKPVLWIEAIPSIYDQLCERLKSFPRQQAVCALLGEVDGEFREFHVSNNANGVSSSVFEFGAFGTGTDSLWPELNLQMIDHLRLEVTTLDGLFRTKGIDAGTYDYWVMDLQGAEKLALAGAAESLKACRALYVEVSTVEVYRNGVLWVELKSWLEAHSFIPLWEPVFPHDDILFIHGSELERARRVFHSDSYLRHNQRRLEHLASLHLDLCHKTVLEVGAGIGDHTSFYLDRGCTILTTDARPENVWLLGDRFRGRDRVEVARLDLANPQDLHRTFDIVHCYGLLYHLDDPQRALEFLAKHCSSLMLLETCVSLGDEQKIYPTGEPAVNPSQAIYGKGCRPTRTWIWTRLKLMMPYVYVPLTQPAHEEFPLDWRVASSSSKGLKRAVFIASRSPVDSLYLMEQLPECQGI